MGYPTIVNIVEQLRRHKEKEGYNTAQLVVQLDAFGWTWQAGHIDGLLAGRMKPTQNEAIFFKRYLLNKFYVYNCS